MFSPGNGRKVHVYSFPYDQTDAKWTVRACSPNMYRNGSPLHAVCSAATSASTLCGLWSPTGSA